MISNQRYITASKVWGQQGHQSIRDAHVLVIGAGGLGCSLLPLLTAEGIGKITLYDGDRIEQKNLGRQTLYTPLDVGHFKAIVARDRLKELNSDVSIKSASVSITPSILEKILSESKVTVVVDAADSFSVTYMASDACLKHNIPLISGSVSEEKGYVGGFCSAVGTRQAPSYRAVFPDFTGKAKTCNEAGVTASTVHTVGSLMASAVFGVCLNHETRSLIGKLLSLDLQTMRFTAMDFTGASEPTSVFETLPFYDAEMMPSDCHMIDVRNENWQEELKQISPQTPVVLGCKTGLRASREAKHLLAQGYNCIGLMATSSKV